MHDKLGDAMKKFYIILLASFIVNNVPAFAMEVTTEDEELVKDITSLNLETQSSAVQASPVTDADMAARTMAKRKFRLQEPTAADIDNKFLPDAVGLRNELARLEADFSIDPRTTPTSELYDRARTLQTQAVHYLKQNNTVENQVNAAKAHFLFYALLEQLTDVLAAIDVANLSEEKQDRGIDLIAKIQADFYLMIMDDETKTQEYKEDLKNTIEEARYNLTLN